MNGRKKGRRMVSWILFFCMMVSFAATALPSGVIEAEAEEKVSDNASDSRFVHPGILHTSESIEAMKKNVADGVQPTLEAYNALKNEAFSNPAWGGRPAERVERPGNYALLYVDIQRAYQMALLYQLGAGEEYGESAVRVLNGWSHTMKTLWGNADRFLAAGIYGYQLANAAELVRDREDFDKDAMDELLLNVFYPLNHEFLLYHNGTSEGRRIRNYWANWDLCNTAGMLAIGIFCDREDIYEEAVEYYRNGAGMGSFYNAMPYVYEEGLSQWQESGRDQGHSTLGISLCGAINEMAWSQGEDLYGLSDNRFLKAAEYVAKYNNGEDVPYSYYERYNSSNGKVEGNPVVSGASRGSRRPVFTAIYNHYVNRMGLEAPELEKILYPDGTTPFTEGATRGGDDPGWQSLTFHNISAREEGKKAKEMNGDLEDGVYRFWNRNSKKTMVDRDGQLQSAEKGTMDEEWWQVKNTGDGEYIITNVKTGRVIQTDADTFTSGASTYTAGTKYLLGEEETGKMNQRLAFLKVTGDYIYRIVSSPCSLVLECSSAGTDDDTGLGQWWYEGGYHQQWYVERKEPSKKRIAGFYFDDEKSGLSGAGAVAAPNDPASLTFVEDKERGKVLSLNGKDYLNVAKEDGGSLLTGCEELTVSYYSKSAETGNGGTLFYAAASHATESCAAIRQQEGKVSVQWGGQNSKLAEADISPGWNHIVAIYASGHVKLYVNGILQAEIENSVSMGEVCGENSILQIGKEFNGLLDDFHIYNYAMSEKDIKAMEGQQLVAEFTFDDEIDGFVSQNARAENIGAPILSDDAKSGKSLSLDGSGSNYLSVVNNMGEPLASGWEEMTVSYWSKVTSSGTNWMFYAAPDDEIQILNSETYLGAHERDSFLNVERYKNTGTRISSMSEKAAKDEWKHVAVSFGRDRTAVYVNGEKKAMLSCYYTVSELLGEESIFYIGRANWGKQGEYCNALLDNVRIYNFALDDTAVKKDYEGYQAAQYAEEDNEDYTADKEAAKSVMAKISAIGNVEYTQECRQKISDARASCDALTEAQKTWVMNYQALVSAEEKYENLKPIEKKRLAYFTFDDEENGFSDGNVEAISQSSVKLSDNAVSGKALELNGSDNGNYLKLVDAEGKSILNGCREVTISYWGKVYGTNANWGFYAAANDEAIVLNREKYLGVNDSGDKIELNRFYNAGERPQSPSVDAEKGEWRYITAVFSEDGTMLYVNGEMASQTSGGDAVSRILGKDGVTYLGKSNWGDGEYYNGLMDEVSIYNYALSQQEITGLYEQYHVPDYPVHKKRIANFTFDDEETGFAGSGAKANASGTNILSRDAVSGRALSLEGDKNYLTLTDRDGNALFKGNKELTVSYWSKVNNTGANWAFYASENADSQEPGKECYLGILENSKITAERYNNNGGRPVTASAQNVQNEWKFVTAVYSLTDTIIYVNGEGGKEEDSTYAIADIVGKDGIAYIGKANWGNGEYYTGLIDEVSIYDCAMGEDEVLELYKSYPEPGTDLAAVEAVEELIAGIGKVTFDKECKAKIEQAREAYGLLTEIQKKILDENISAALEEAEAEYKRLEEEANQGGEEDQNAADAVEDLINAIGEVRFDEESKARIDRAREAYELLSEPQKKLINELVYAKLTGAEETYGGLWEVHEKEEREKAEKEKSQLGTISVKENQNQIVNTDTDSKDVKGSKFASLKLKASGGNKSVKLSWSRQKSANGYLIYGAPCGKQMKLLKNASSAQKSYKVAKLKKGKYYKFMVCAYRNIYGEKRIIATSVTVHACTNGGKYANPSSISCKKSKVSLKKGKTFTIKPKYNSKKKVKTHIAKFRYESSNSKIATVSKKGKMKGKRKGNCYIYLYTQNGIYKRIKVTVK